MKRKRSSELFNSFYLVQDLDIFERIFSGKDVYTSRPHFLRTIQFVKDENLSVNFS